MITSHEIKLKLKTKKEGRDPNSIYDIICFNCGEGSAMGSVFCPNCGSKIN